MQRASFVQANSHWVIFAVMAVASLLSYFHQVGLATVSGEVATSLGTDAAALGLMSAAFSWPYAAMQIPAGLLSDSLGPRKSVTLFLLIAAGGTILFACATGLVQALVARVLIGIGISMVAVPFMKLTAVWFPPRDFSKVTALSFTIGGAGNWLATSPMAYSAMAYGWRTPFWALSIVTVVCAVLVWIVVRDTPDNSPRSCSAEKNETLSLTCILKTILANRQTWILECWYFCQGGIFFSFVGLWGGQYSMQVLGKDPTASGWILSPAACALMTAPIFTWLAAKIGRKRLLVLLPVCSAVLAFPLTQEISTLTDPLLCLLFLLFSMAAIGGAAVLFGAAVDQFPVAYSGTVTGFINMFPFAGGAVLQQGIGALIEMIVADGASQGEAFTTAFSLYCLAGLAAALLGLLYRDTSFWEE